MPYETDNSDSLVCRLIISMKSVISEMKRVKAILDEQITRLENHKSKIEIDQ